MTKKTEEQKSQRPDGKLPEGKLVKIPQEYLIEGVRQAVADIKLKMLEARRKYGSQYNRKNPYEEFGRRFGYDNPVKIWEEYDLIWTRQSTQPSIIRKVAKLLGDQARIYAINRMREDMKNEAPADKE